MIKLCTVVSAEFDSPQEKRIVKVNVMGKEDTQTSIQSSPFGIDSNPVKDLIAVYAETSEIGRTILLGYLNKKQAAAIGETRIYATDSDGGELTKGYIHLKNDETIEMGGNTDNLVRFIPLDSGIATKDIAINIELGKIAAVLNSLAPGAYVPTPVSTTITSAKIDEIKTLS